MYVIGRDRAQTWVASVSAYAVSLEAAHQPSQPPELHETDQDDEAEDEPADGVVHDDEQHDRDDQNDAHDHQAGTNPALVVALLMARFVGVHRRESGAQICVR